MFEFLFKYSPVVFSQGQLGLNRHPPALLLAAILLVFIAALWIFYRKSTIEISAGFRTAMISLKLLALGILLFLLLEPHVTVSTVIPKKSSLLVLVDDSRSMSIRDLPGEDTRSAAAQKLLGTPDQPGLLAELGKNFRLQTYKFSSDVNYMTATGELSAEGNRTDLAQTLEFAAEQGRQGAVAGVVLLTDGVNNSDSDPLEVAGLMKNRRLPVFAIGIGSEDGKDLELTKVTADHSVVENSLIELSAILKNTGLEKEPVEVELREDGALIKKQRVSLQGASTRISMRFSPGEKGFVRYSLSATANVEESIPGNNSKSFIIDNRSRKARVLYVEGYPRAEFKFLRRALDEDPGIEIVSLLRTGKDKFYRQGIKDENELADGYPKTRKALFQYDAILFGSIERAFFTGAQLQNTLDFVSQRGGGFMMIGGSSTFGLGGYDGSVVEKLLPVHLPHSGKGQALSRNTAFQDKYKLLLTPEGLRNPMLQLSPDPAENRSRWDSLPDLEGYNLLGRAKPGATILAVHPLSEPEDPRIILAQQHFGRGRTMVFSTSSSWLWQMGMPHDDMSHERFWRQVLRWLALSAPSPIETQAGKETYVPGETVTLTTEVRDSTFVPVQDAIVVAHVKTPDGERIDSEARWSADAAGSYVATLAPDQEGVYLVEAEVRTRDHKLLGRAETAFLVETSRKEFNNAHLQTAFLQRMADVTGGHYYAQDQIDALPADISVMKSSYSKLADHDLWDMPVWFAIVVITLALEWVLRRNKGLS